MKLTIGDSQLTLGDLRAAWEQDVTVEIGASARERIARSRNEIERVVASGRQVYGVNTGFGQLAQVRIGNAELSRLQENLVRSHSVGVGPLLPDAVVRLTLVTKAAALSQGYSGVRMELVEALCALLDHRIYPCIPAKGSVGASGDLAPLAHMAGVLLGIGDVRVDGRQLPAAEALAAAGLPQQALAPKEGLALLNGTQVSTALALAALLRTENLLGAALAAGALCVDAIRGSDTPFDPRIQQVRGHAGQAAVAAQLLALIRGSQIRAEHVDCGRVQDPYSIRCQPQVVGACLDVMTHVAGVLRTEANAVTDNPLVFHDRGDVLSGGNFHAEPVALAADYLALAIAELGALSERRIALLIDSHLSGLPAFLVEQSGLNSGFMMAQVTAAALASENKALAHPASVDSIPTSANQEDHVSMATAAANRLHAMLDNTAHVVAIELLAAAQGVEFHRPQRSSEMLELVVGRVRGVSPRYTADRSLSADIMAVAALIDAGAFREYASSMLPSSAG
ncbi:MAG: histidine ammonia-lyase [Gammaproteobacteria bacterium]|nr:histidine ammonia-lyase [Gammaproteobacteria bacterium]MDH4255026.1 histidine ammonia-lyase [Gammaproteobacteria bacterium]MDH5309273.1 histidine ammonia-lyase [Gammaproteobacteria bacterium]